MLRHISACLLLAALVTGGSLHAAQTTPGRSTAPAAPKAAAPKAAPSKAAAPKAAATAPVPVTPADMASMMGTWTIPLETPTGRLVASLVFRVEAGKVVAGISAPQFPEQKMSSVTKSGQVFTLRASMDYQGPLAAYSGPVSMVMTLTPKGPDYVAWLDFNSAAYQIGGTATKKK